jgi:hypothetical protein
LSVIDEARNKLEAEIGKLETLYFVSTITYKREAKARYQKSKGLDKPVIFDTGDWKREVAHNAGHFRSIVDDVLPKTLRETVFVRLISAVEVFHVDLIRAIFTYRRDLLARNQPLELPYAYLASLTTLSELITRLVDRDCRSITSGGFEDATKYFKRQFQVDLNALPGYAALDAAHDLRHVLVHRLGYTDEQYRRAYESKKRRISVDQPYLLEVIKHVRTYADALVAQAATLAVSQPSRSLRDQSDLALHIQIDSPEAGDLTSPSFFFLYNERYYTLRDLIRERHVAEREMHLALRGNSKVLRVYLRKIRALSGQKKLTILTPSKTRTVKTPKPTQSTTDFV